MRKGDSCLSINREKHKALGGKVNVFREMIVKEMNGFSGELSSSFALRLYCLRRRHSCGNWLIFILH